MVISHKMVVGWGEAGVRMNKSSHVAHRLENRIWGVTRGKRVIGNVWLSIRNMKMFWSARLSVASGLESNSRPLTHILIFIFWEELFNKWFFSPFKGQKRGYTEKQHVQQEKHKGHEEGTLKNDATSWNESVQIAETLKKAKSWSIIQTFLMKLSLLFPFFFFLAFLLIQSIAFLNSYGYFPSFNSFFLCVLFCPSFSLSLSTPWFLALLHSALLRPLWLFLSQRKPLNANRRFLSSVCSMQSHLFGNGHLTKWR